MVENVKNKLLLLSQEEEASRVVAEQGPGLPRAWRDKYERETRKHWDLFYARNATNFFKDRHCKWISFKGVVIRTKALEGGRKEVRPTTIVKKD